MKKTVVVVAFVVLGLLVAPSSQRDVAGWLDDMDDIAETDEVADTNDEAAGVWKKTTDFLGQAYLGAGDMLRAYTDMREANFKHSDKYFHARGNHDAAQRGPGGEWIAKVISDGREFWQGVTGRGDEDTEADQFANEWGRAGGDPNVFRPDGLPDNY